LELDVVVVQMLQQVGYDPEQILITCLRSHSGPINPVKEVPIQALGDETSIIEVEHPPERLKIQLGIFQIHLF
jgi:hypothetical protein